MSRKPRLLPRGRNVRRSLRWTAGLGLASVSPWSGRNAHRMKVAQELPCGAFAHSSVAPGPNPECSYPNLRNFRTMKIHAYVLSWTGRHENALAIAAAIQPSADQLTIIYSDRDDSFELAANCEAIKVPNSWFFGQKFELGMRKCASDVMLCVDADVTCEDWPRLIERCRWAYQEGQHVGVWAPLVDYTPHSLARTRILTFPGSTLHAVCFTDSITFALPRMIREQLLGLGCERNTYGWGVDIAAAAIGLQQGLVPVLDESVTVRHPNGSGYARRDAHRLMLEFVKRLPAHQAVYLELINSYYQGRRRNPLSLMLWRRLRWLRRLIPIRGR